MKKLTILTLLFVLLTNGFAVTHLNIKVTRDGVMQILNAALKFNNMGVVEDPSAIIGAMAFKQSIPADKLSENKIVQIIDEVSSIDFKKQYDFFVINDEIKVKGKVNKSDLTFKITNFSKKGFLVDLAVAVDNLQISTNSIQICERANLKTKRCDGKLLQGKFRNIRVEENSNKKIEFKASLKASIIKDEVTFKIVKTSNNINDDFAKSLFVDFDLVIPDLKVKINGVEAIMSTAHIKDQILEQKNFLAEKLLNFAGEYLTKDLIEMLNQYFKKVKLPTGYSDELYSTSTFNFNNSSNNNVDDNRFYTHPADATYVAPVVRYEDFRITTPNTELLGEDEIVKKLGQLIKSASFEVSLSSLYTATFDKSINAALTGNLIINGTSLSLPTYIKQRKYSVNNGYGKYYIYNKQIQDIKFENLLNKKYGIGLAISDPVFNGLLKTAEKQNLFTKVFRQEAGEMASGIYVTNVHLHTQPRRKDATSNSYYKPKIYVVAEIKVDVANVHTEKWYEWLGKKVGGLLEGNVYFPLQFAITPYIVKKDGKTQLKLTIDDPLDSNNDPKNYFGYYSDFDEDNIYGVVRDQFRTQLNSALKKTTDPIYVDLSDLARDKGVSFVPVDVDIEQTGHFVLYLNIDDINTATLKGKK